jgi:hypothetical protein
MAEDSEIGARFRALGAGQRIAAIGALTIMGSMVLPWYGFKLIPGLSQTGLDAFGWGQAALALTAIAVLVLIFRTARGRAVPRPLAEGPLLVLAGVWAAVVVAYLMIDRPDAFDPLKVTLTYGIFVALGGAFAMILGGLRVVRGKRPRGPMY